MNTFKQSNSISIRVMWLAVALAIITSVSHVLMAANLLGVGDLQTQMK